MFIGVSRLITLILLLCLSHGVLAAKRADDPLQQQVAGALTQEGLIGATWATLDNGKVRLGAAGFSNMANKTAMTIDHRVHVGSITKTLLATGVLALVGDGRLSLDTPVSQLLPIIRFDNPWQQDQPVLVRHLLDHTAGLQNARFWHLFNTHAKADSPLGQLFAQDPGLLQVRTRPGQSFAYSNIGFNLLAMVIETVNQTRYEAALQQLLLDPLAMTDSTFDFTSQLGQPHPGLAYGHLDRGQLIGAIPGYLRAAGQFTTTAGDMAKFARFLLSDGRMGSGADSKVIVDSALLRQMGQVAATASQQAGLNAGGAHGLWRRDRHGVVGLCHGGNTVGYRGMFCLYPEQNKAFFVMVNSDHETADYDRIDALIVDTLAVKPALKPQTGQAQAGQYHDWLGWYEQQSNPFNTFSYLDKLFNISIFSQIDAGQQPLWQLNSVQSASLILTPLGNNLFAADNRATASHVLFYDQQGNPLISNGFHTYRKVDFLPLAMLWFSLAIGLLGAGYILLKGLYALVAQPGCWHHKPIVITLTMYPAFVLPIPFFLLQSLLQLGNVTVASVLLATVTALSTVLCVIALFIQYKRCLGLTLDAVAIGTYLQWSLVLWFWGLFPLRLWAI